MKASATTTVRIARKGRDGVSVNVSPQNVVFSQGGAVRTVEVYVDLYSGGDRIPYQDADRGNMQCSVLGPSSSIVLGADGERIGGLFWRYGTTDEGRFYYVLSKSPGVVVNATVPFTVLWDGMRLPGTIEVVTVPDGERGPVPRGPVYWKDYPGEFPFESGASGETYFDTVYNIISGQKKFYTCRRSHTKAAAREPGVSANWDTYWEAASEIPFLVTRYALVDFLSTEQVTLKNLSLIDSRVPTIGEIYGIPKDIEVGVTAQTGASGSGSSDVGSASSPKSVTVTKTVTVSGRGYGRCYFGTSLVNTSGMASRHKVNIVSVTAKVNGVAVTDDGSGFSFTVAPGVTKYSIEVTYSYWLRYAGSTSGSDSQLSVYKVEARIGGAGMTGYMRFFPKPAPEDRDPRTIVGTNGFVTTDDDEMLFHVQHTEESHDGHTYPKAVTMLVGNFGIRITGRGIERTLDGGLGWLAGIGDT